LTHLENPLSASQAPHEDPPPKLLFAFALATAVHAEAQALILLEALFADPDIQAVQISPTGRYLTWLAPRNQRINLAIFDCGTKKVR
jgi:hypothetical protein